LAVETSARGRRSAEELRFEPIQQQRAHEYVAEQIRRHIALRLIAPGESLPTERELASIFGVGRPTIQHAMRLLEAGNLVEARRGRRGGTFVTAPDDDAEAMEELITRLLRGREEIEELLVDRAAIEPAAARLAAANRRKDDLKALRAALAGMQSFETEPEYMRLDTEFHLAVAEASRNRFIARQSEEIRMRLNDAISLLPESATWHRRIDREHERIAAAIERGDGPAAARAMEVHVAYSEQGLRAVLAAIRRKALR
jgi:GntR family transcriptional regulator, transcriptional repressor for pyruvate dehydrogenase complex